MQRCEFEKRNNFVYKKRTENFWFMKKKKQMHNERSHDAINRKNLRWDPNFPGKVNI